MILLALGVSLCQLLFAQEDSLLYKHAIKDASQPESDEISHNLLAISKDNKALVWKTIEGEDYILMVCLKEQVSYYKPYLDSAFYNTGNYDVWVTATPELLNTFNTADQNIKHRLNQLLGLPPNPSDKFFVEFWVKPSDLFRPCPDQEVTDNTCELNFPANTDSAHIKWIDELRAISYSNPELYKQFPWTQLGYTYDWNHKNKKNIGLSEFVIRKNSKTVVNGIYTIKDYLTMKQQYTAKNK